jgi:hypothetical protein
MNLNFFGTFFTEVSPKVLPESSTKNYTASAVFKLCKDISRGNAEIPKSPEDVSKGNTGNAGTLL